MLGSMSDDEEDDDDEDEDVDEICDGNESDEDNESEGEETNDLSLKVEGKSIKPQSPLLAGDDEIKQELQKVRASIVYNGLPTMVWILESQ